MPRLLLCALLLVAAGKFADAVVLPCAGPKGTGLPNCAECIDKTCYWCAPAVADAVYSPAGQITKCVATVSNAACKKMDRNCNQCSTINGKMSCARCMPKFVLAPDGSCVRGNCQTTSQNPGCLANGCNPDGTCRQCKNPALVVVPDNAQWVNRGYPASKCMGRVVANKLSNQIGLTPAVIPPNCAETDAFFRCNACKPGFVLNVSGTTRSCQRQNTACRRNPYGQYCLSCNPKGQCTQCVEGRSPFRGVCALNCQGLFGFFCNHCTAKQCTQLFTQKVYDYFG